MIFLRKPTMKNRSIKQVETNSRKTTSREEKLKIGYAKRGKTGKITDLGRKRRLTRP
jgi:hypothetical protein